MNLPKALTDSLKNIRSFNREAFEHVHASGEQVTSIRVNPLKWSADKANLHSSFNIQQRVLWSTSGYYLSERPSFTLDPLLHAGAYYVQEASSMFLEQAMKQTADLSQPLLVLDLCAAPGGKSTLLQSVINKDSLLVSNEVIQSRVSILKENCIKWGAQNIIVTNNDPKDFSRLKGLFDVLVVDAPCSGSGLFRRDPAAIEEWSEDNVQLCSQRQQRILADAWDCLKEGGILIYSTCSYSSEEDEQIMDWIMKELHAESLRLAVEKDWMIDEVQSAADSYGYRFWPYEVKGEGFFIAAFKKKEDIGAVKLKVKQASLPSKKEIAIAQNWIVPAGETAFVMQGQNIAAIPQQWNEVVQYLMQELRVRYAGVELGTVAKTDLIPEHALALSTIIDPAVYAVTLTLEQALNYLRKNEITIDSSYKGWALAAYEGLPLGWMKMLGNRINNYYPKEWRILKQ